MLQQLPSFIVFRMTAGKLDSQPTFSTCLCYCLFLFFSSILVRYAWRQCIKAHVCVVASQSRPVLRSLLVAASTHRYSEVTPITLQHGLGSDVWTSAGTRVFDHRRLRFSRQASAEGFAGEGGQSDGDSGFWQAHRPRFKGTEHR